MKNLFLFLSLILCGSCSPKRELPALGRCSDSEASPETEALYNRLFNLLDSGIMMGHQDDLAYGHTWYNEPNRSDVYEVIGKYPSVIGWEIGRIESAAPYNLDSVYFDNMKRYIHDGVPSIPSVGMATILPPEKTPGTALKIRWFAPSFPEEAIMPVS